MKNLSDSLSPEDLATLDTFFMEHYQANMAQLGILRPFTLLSMMFVKGLECEVPGSYEALLMKEAASREWEVLGLETIKDQVNVFEQVSTEEQVAWLVDYASNLDEFKADIEKLITAYRAEALQELIDLMDEYPEYKVIEEPLLYERNENWIEPMIELASEQPTFFAVGAAHLGSDRGVVQLLQNKGYTVTPIFE